MALKQVDLTVAAPPVSWLVPGLIPRGYVSFLAAREGTGKTTILTGLAWQMTRPEGRGEFLGRAVGRGPVVYVNTDAPDGQSRPVRHWLDQHRHALPDGDTRLITILEPEGAGLHEQDVQALESLVQEQQVKLLIIDSFMGSFPGVEGNRLDKVLAPMMALRDLAARTGTALILTDHLPKRARGEKDGDRGVIGSVGKQAQARAALLLSRVDPAEVADRDVLRVYVEKSSFARSKYALGLEVQHDGGPDGNGVVLAPFALPDEDEGRTGSGRAKRAVRERLEAAEDPVGYKVLVQLAIEQGSIQERSAKQAVRDVLEAFGDRVDASKQPGRGGPMAYRLKRPLEQAMDPGCPGPGDAIQEMEVLTW